MSITSSTSARALPSNCMPFRASCNSSMSSAETAEKLLTKLSGFLISWAMPAVSWPREASFSVCTSRSCAICNSSSDFASSRVRASTLSNRRTFSIAIAAWSANVETSSICLSVNGRTTLRVNMMTPIGIPSRRRGTPSTVRNPPILLPSVMVYSGSASTSFDLDGACLRARRARAPSPALARSDVRACTRSYSRERP